MCICALGLFTISMVASAAGSAPAAPLTIDVPAGYRYGAEPPPQPSTMTSAGGYIAPNSAADATDPVIVAQAAVLNHDPAQIFAFVRDRIAIDPYYGSLRGAHGALSGKAGNALDRASLGIALLRASGFTARYAQGTLAFADAQKIVARAFDDPQRMVGCNNPGALADPRNDFGLISEAQAHFWIEYQAVANGPWIALDPAFANANSGDTFTASSGNFDDVPANLQHRMRVRVIAETYSTAGAVYGFGLSTSTMLDQSFDTVDLVDKPVTVGHFVSRQRPPGLAISATINTYSPYVTVGDSAIDIADYQIVRGADYTETFTNFPLGTTLLTGVFVDIDVISPQSPNNPQTYRRVLVDRIGYAVRQTGGSVQAPQPDAPPALTTLDLLTIQASPSQQPIDAFAARQSRLTALRSELAPLVAQVNALPPPGQQTPTQVALRQHANELDRGTTIALLELMTAAYAGYADSSVRDIGASYLVKPWIASPRLTIAHSNVDNAGFHLNLDIRKNDLRVYPLPGISYTNAAHFERARGMAESLLEGQVFSAVSGLPSRNIGSVFSNQADLVAITRYDPNAVDALDLSADAKARIRDTVAGGQGRTVLAPRAPVMVGSTPYSVWLETDPSTGYTISTGEDGTHQAIGDYAGLLLDLFGVDSLETQMAKFIGQVESLGVSGIAFTAAVIDAISSGQPFANLGAQIKAILNSATGPLQQIMDFLEQSGASEYCEGGCGLIQNMVSGLLDGLKAFKDAIGAGDPPLPPILLSPPQPPLPAPVTPGASPGLTLNVLRDTRYFVPYNGAEVPTVYLAQITNTGPATDTYRIESAGVDGPYTLTTAVPQITLAPGASGEVGVCLLPNGALPPGGTHTTFRLRVHSIFDPPDQTFPGDQVAPDVSALLLRIAPDNATLHAGDSVPATLTLESLGNTATNVNLATILPAGLTISGVPASAMLAVGETRSLPVTISLAGNVPSGSELSAQLRGEFGASAPAVAHFTAHATSSLTTCTADAALQAQSIGRTGLAATLVRLAGAMDDLAADTASAGKRNLVLAQLDDLVNVQFNVSFLTPYSAPLSAKRAALAAAAASGVLVALSDIDATLCSLRSALEQGQVANIALGLIPTQNIALPTQAVTVRVNLYNGDAVPRVFDIAIDGVPAGVSAVLSSNTVTVPALNQTNGCCGAPPLTVAFTNTDGQARAFDYAITATPHDQPTLPIRAGGTFVLRNDVVRVASVNTTPLSTDPGTPVTIDVKLMNSLNAPRNVFVFWTVRDGTGTPRRSGSSSPSTLASGDGIVALPPFTVDTSGFNGAYTIEVDAVDQSNCCNTLPGGVGVGSFLIGQPFSALLSATPSSVPLGDSTINYSLALSHESAPTPVIDARSSLAMPASTRSFVRSGSNLYVCQADRISIVDVSNPDAPAIVATFATDLLGVGYSVVGCNLDGSTLVLAYNLQSPTSFDDLKIVAYDIGGANALAPLQLNATPVQVPKRFGGTITFNGTHQGSLTTAVVIYNPFSGFIAQQGGNLLTLDFSSPAAPLLTGELYHHFGAGDTNDPIYGGPSVINASLPQGSFTHLATTTATGDGFGTGPGVGRIATVDTSQLPSNCPGAPNPCIVHNTDVSQAVVLFGIAAQGNAGVVAGDTFGAYDGRSGNIGQLTLSAIDFSAATAPVVQSTLVSLMLNHRPTGAPCNQPYDAGGTGLNALDNNYYAVGAYNPLSCSWVLALVDANDTANVRIIPYDVPSVLRQTILNGNKLYALTDTTILIYDYATIAGPAITASVDIPKGTGVSVNPASFNVAPSSVDSSATDHDRYTWYRPTATSITWQGAVSGMRPGEIRGVALGGEVDYTLPSIGAGKLTLGAVNVSAGQSMAVTPALQGAELGATVSYTITISNPSATAVNYALSVNGFPTSWLKHLDTPLLVPANGQATSTLTLATTLADPQYTSYPFIVTGVASSGFTTDAGAVFNTGARNTGGDQINAVYAASLTPLTSPVLVGRADSATLPLRAANLGNAQQGFGLGTLSAPPGVYVGYAPSGFYLDAGTQTDVAATVFAPQGATPGTYPVTVFMNTYGPQVSATFDVTIVNQGVQVFISPSSGTATTPFTMTVVNRGTSTDTFDLSALGALGPAVHFAQTSVTLDADASTTVALTLDDTVFVPPGTASFDVQAVSRAQSAARARASAQIVTAARKDVALAGTPQSIAVAAAPASRSFGVALRNAGNVEDVYTLAIVSSSANVTAALRDASGAATQSLAPLRLPGNALALANVDATLQSGSAGTVTLRATSQSDATVVATTVLTLSVNGAANILLGAPGALEFGDQALTTTSDVHSIVLSNSGLGPFTIGSIVIAGANAADFALATGANACTVGGTIAANGGSCALYVTFTPNALGSRSATVSVADIGATTTIPVALHGNGIDAVGHLSVLIQPNRDYVQFGRALNYLVTARNGAATSTSGVDVSTTLPAEVDAAFATWLCINAQDANASCTPNGNGPLVDSGVRIPPDGSVNYLLTAPVKAQPPSEQVIASASVSSSADPGPYGASSTPTRIVVYRDGFQPYGDGASGNSTEGAVALTPLGNVALDKSNLVLDLGAVPQRGLIDTLLVARTADSSGFRIERLSFGSRTWLRVVAISATGMERPGAWVIVVGGATTIGIAQSSGVAVARLRTDAGDAEVTLASDLTQYNVFIAAPQ